MTTNEGLRSKARSLLFSLQKETHSSPGLKAPSALAPLWVAKALESSATENKTNEILQRKAQIKKLL